MNELIIMLRNEKELREVLHEVIELIEENEALRNEREAFDDNIDDVRRIANKLHESNERLLRKCHGLELDNKALRQFIVDEVHDEDKLAKIFF